MVSKNSIVEHTGLQHGLYCVTICTVFAIVVAATALMGDEPEVETATPTWVSYDWMPQAEDCSFYVAGPETGIECGQPRETQVIFFRVPLSFEGEITFRLEGTHLPFETVSGARARLYGGPGAYTDTDGHQIYPESDYQGTLLASKPLVTDHRPQRLHFGPFASSQGESVDGWGYFKLVFTVAKGRGLQPFRVAVAPADKVEGFCFNASLYMDGAKFGRALLYLDSVDKKTPITGITSGFAKGLSLREGDTSLALKAPNSENWIRYGINNFAAGDGRSALEWMNGTLGEGNNLGKRLIVAFTDSKGQPLRLFGNSRIVEQSPRITAKRPKPAGQRPQTADRRPKKAAIPDPVSSIKNPAPQHSNNPVSGIDTPTLPHFGTPTLQHSNTPTLPHFGTPTLQHSNTPTLQHSNTLNTPNTVSPTPQPSDPYLTFRLDASSFFPDTKELTFAWDFGDGALQEGVKVSHSYSNPGQYQVTLRVTNLQTGQNKEYSQVVVANVRPVPFMEFPSECTAGKVIEFDAGKSKDTPGDRLTYGWDFGDGNTGTGKLAKHSYPAAGNYTVTLTVEDDKNTFCSKATLSSKLAVSEAKISPRQVSRATQSVDLSDPRIQAHQARFSAWEAQSDRK